VATLPAMSEAAPRVRFAPSPTGYFHVGGARTALYNWLFVRRLGGRFVLRIEDTDRDRSHPDWTTGILAALEWLGITWDEGPILQSERRHLYEAAARRLFEEGRAYACDCTAEAVRARTAHAATPGYDGYCRDRGLEPGIGKALRFRVPDEGVTRVHDVVRGDVEFANATIEDFVIQKSNGDALFVLAVVVDDLDLAITHVIRGEEHLPTTPKAVLLWEALGDGRPLPVFAHLPNLVNERRQKLSKRRDRVAVEDYRALGYLPEAMVNYLALLGWAPRDGREILGRDELVELFRLEDVNRSPAFFDLKRLDHFNGLYIRALDDAEFLRRARPFLEAPEVPFASRLDWAVLERLAPLVKERVTTLGEVPDLVAFAFADPFVVDEAAFEKVIVKDDAAPAILKSVLAGLDAAAFNAQGLRSLLEEVAATMGRKLNKAQAPVRVAALGRTVGLPLFESLEVLGRDRVRQRLASALAKAAGGS
jgi:glutamyl-tRNA synthetase